METQDAQTVTYPGAPFNKLVLLCYCSPAVVKAEKLSSVCSAFGQQKLCLHNSRREQTGTMHVIHYTYLARVAHRSGACITCELTMQLQTATDAADADGMLLGKVMLCQRARRAV